MFYVLLGVLGVAVLLAVRVKRNKQKHYQKQLNAVVYIKSLKTIITLVQQHRGLSVARLQGEESVLNTLNDIKRVIATQIADLSNTPVANNERWDSFCDHWSRLQIVIDEFSPEHNFDQHTSVIKNLIYLLEDTAENFSLTAKHVPQLETVGYLWRELIFLAETIGQSRAIGVAVTTEKKCSHVNEIKLNFLIQNMQSATKTSLKELTCLTQEKIMHQQLIDDATDKINKLITVIHEELITSPTISIANTDYFELATSSITAVNHVFDHQIKQLEKIINDKK